MSLDELRVILTPLPVQWRVVALQSALGLSLGTETQSFAAGALDGAATHAPKPAAPVAQPAAARSYPVTVQVAREVVKRQEKDSVMIQILRMAVSNIVAGVAIVDWKDVRPLTGDMRWGDFGRRHRSALHRSLRSILREEGLQNTDRAELLWEAPGWTPDGKGDWLSGELRIDGPAVEAMRIALT